MTLAEGRNVIAALDEAALFFSKTAPQTPLYQFLRMALVDAIHIEVLREELECSHPSLKI